MDETTQLLALYCQAEVYDIVLGGWDFAAINVNPRSVSFYEGRNYTLA